MFLEQGVKAVTGGEVSYICPRFTWLREICTRFLRIHSSSITMTYAYTQSFTCHEGSVNCLVFSSDGEYLASGSDDKAVFIHESKRGLQIQKILGETSVTALAWTPCGKTHERLLIGYRNGRMVWIDVLKVCHSYISCVSAIYNL